MIIPGFDAEKALFETSRSYRTGGQTARGAFLTGVDAALRGTTRPGPAPIDLNLTAGPLGPVASGGCSGGGCHCHGILSCGQLFHLCCNWFAPPACVHDGTFDGLHCVCKSNGMCGDFGPAAPLGITSRTR
jgi:hypothetical protein